MSRILCVCDQGNNRSVTVAHQLKYLGHDCLPVGLSTNSESTIAMLCDWADFIILTDRTQRVPERHQGKVKLWDFGPDNYPRPMNPRLLALVRRRVEQDRASLHEGVRATEPAAA